MPRGIPWPEKYQERMVVLFCEGYSSFNVAQIMKKEFSYPFTKNGVLGAMRRYTGGSVERFLRSYVSDWPEEETEQLRKIIEKRYGKDTP